MTEYGDNNLTQTEGEPVQAPGLLLKAQRESAGLTHQAVGEALHLTVHYIKALENDDYSKLPGMTFVKGYFRSYARFLNMDVEHVLACYEKYLSAQGLVSSASEFASRSRSKSDQAMIWAVVAGLILVIALVVGWWFFGRTPETGQKVTSIRSISSPATTTIPATAAPSASLFGQTPEQTPGQTPGQTAQANTALPAADVTPDLEESLPDNDATETLAADNQSLSLTDGETSTVMESDQDSLSPAAPVATNADLGAVDAEATRAGDTANDGSLQYTSTESGNRQIRLLGEGSDRLELNLVGSSWAEIEDAERVNLFNDMLRVGDTLAIQGKAPFYVLLGDARSVELTFNAQTIQIDGLIRSDNTARFELSDSGLAAALNTN